MLSQIETITWILTSKRKPEKDGVYLTTNSKGNTEVLFYSKGDIDEDEWWLLCHFDETIDLWTTTDKLIPEPIAWAELPKGYERKEQ